VCDFFLIWHCQKSRCSEQEVTITGPCFVVFINVMKILIIIRAIFGVFKDCSLHWNRCCYSPNRSPSPSASPQSSPHLSPRQHHKRDHSKGEISVGSCKDTSPLDKSEIIEVSNMESVLVPMCVRDCKNLPLGQNWLDCHDGLITVHSDN
jgi:hypothetical protein